TVDGTAQCRCHLSLFGITHLCSQRNAHGVMRDFGNRFCPQAGIWEFCVLGRPTVGMGSACKQSSGHGHRRKRAKYGNTQLCKTVERHTWHSSCVTKRPVYCRRTTAPPQKLRVRNRQKHSFKSASSSPARLRGPERRRARNFLRALPLLNAPPVPSRPAS